MCTGLILVNVGGGGGGGAGVLPYKGLMGTCGQPGYVFRDFCLKQGIKFINFCLNHGIDLSIFVLNKISVVGEGPSRTVFTISPIFSFLSRSALTSRLKKLKLRSYSKNST